MPVRLGIRVIRIVLRNCAVQRGPTLNAESLEGPVDATGVIHAETQTCIASRIRALLNKIAL